MACGRPPPPPPPPESAEPAEQVLKTPPTRQPYTTLFSVFGARRHERIQLLVIKPNSPFKRTGHRANRGTNVTAPQFARVIGEVNRISERTESSVIGRNGGKNPRKKKKG